MFELTKEELQNWRSKFATSNSEIMGLRRPPFAFTEHGVLMLSSVLKREKVITINIRIMRIFIKIRRMLYTNEALLMKMNQVEQQLIDHGEDIHTLFEYVDELIKDK